MKRTSRRTFLQTSMSGVASIALGVNTATGETGLAPLPESQADPSGHHASKPNIIFILADDMGYGDLGSLNFGASQTPALDQLMHEGTLMTQHYAGSAVCSPSRACLLTGRYPIRVGVADTLRASGLNSLLPRERTVADYLQAGGYVTGQIGKWHVGWEEPLYRPNNRGFKEAVTLCGGDHWNWKLDRNGTLEESDGRYLADVLNDEAVAFVQRHHKEPFFLYLAHFAPHAPLQAPEEDIKPFREAGLPENVARLYGMIRRMDAGIGRVMEQLDKLGLRDNTLVIFSSDNGPQFGPSWTDRTSVTRYNCGFNGHKDLVYEGGIRVPAIVRWPAGLPERHWRHDMVHFNDWTPTLLDIAGVREKPVLPFDGRSILPILRGEPDLVPPRRYWQFSRYYPTVLHNAAVRDENWKLVRPTPNDVSGHVLGVLEAHRGIVPNPANFNPQVRHRPELPPALPPQLFNLASDPGELQDLSAQNPERVARMSSDLDRWFDDVMRDLHNGHAHRH